MELTFRTLVKVKEKHVAVRTAVAKERAACMAKVDLELQLARQAVEDKEREVKMYRMRELALLEELEHYKTTIRRVVESEEFKNAPDEMSISHVQEILKGLRPDKDEVEVSESKKVRLEESDDEICLTRRLQMLENDNKLLNVELQQLRESRDSVEADIEFLEANKVRLELELMNERSRRILATPEASTSAEIREKDMNTSVSVVKELGPILAPALEPQCMCTMHCNCGRRQLMKKAPMPRRRRHISTNSCETGDLVRIFWNPTYENYTIHQESSTLYFLNADCLAALDLCLNPDGTPKTIQTIAEVVDKEYCHAKKVRHFRWNRLTMETTRT